MYFKVESGRTRLEVELVCVERDESVWYCSLLVGRWLLLGGANDLGANGGQIMGSSTVKRLPGGLSL